MLFLSGLFILLLIIIILFLNRQRLTNRNKYERSENEKLKIELTLHQKDLSDAALEIVRSNNAYGGLLHDVEQIGRTAKGDNRRFFRQIIIGQKMLSQEETWRQFNIQFEKMNSGFYKALRELEPDLTESERKICALMALGLTNKEICAVTFQPIRSIYTYKNRLRKRFSYANDEDLAKRLAQLLSN
jgi:DNA-binding CsgD family transcriptional regulator